MASSVIKPEDFGGVREGQADDTEAVKKALDEAATTGTRVQLEATLLRSTLLMAHRLAILMVGLCDSDHL